MRIPQWTEEEKAAIQALLDRPEPKIDYSDIPYKPLSPFAFRPGLMTPEETKRAKDNLKAWAGSQKKAS